MNAQCDMCLVIRSGVAYSVDYGGKICDACDRKLYEAFANEQLRFHPLGTLTWGGWQYGAKIEEDPLEGIAKSGDVVGAYGAQY